MSVPFNPNIPASIPQQPLGHAPIPQPNPNGGGPIPAQGGIIPNHGPIQQQNVQQGGAFSLETLSLDKPAETVAFATSIKNKIDSNAQEAESKKNDLEDIADDKTLKHNACKEVKTLSTTASRYEQANKLLIDKRINLDNANHDLKSLNKEKLTLEEKLTEYGKNLNDTIKKWEQKEKQLPSPLSGQDKIDWDKQKKTEIGLIEKKIKEVHLEVDKIKPQILNAAGTVKTLTNQVELQRQEVIGLKRHVEALAALQNGDASQAKALGFHATSAYQNKHGDFKFNTQDPEAAIDSSNIERYQAKLASDGANKAYGHARALSTATDEVSTAIQELATKLPNGDKKEIETAYKKLEKAFGDAAKAQHLDDVGRNALLSIQKNMQASYARETFRQTALDFADKGSKEFKLGLSAKANVHGVAVGGGLEIDAKTGKNSSSGVHTATNSLKGSVSAGADIGVVGVTGDASVKGGKTTKYMDSVDHSRSQSTHTLARMASDGFFFGPFKAIKATRQRQATLDALPLARQLSYDLHEAGLIEDDTHIERMEPMIGKRSGQEIQVKLEGGVTAKVTGIQIKGGYSYTSTWDAPIKNRFDELTNADEYKSNADKLFPEDGDQGLKIVGDGRSGTEIKNILEPLLQNNNVGQAQIRLQGQTTAEALMKSAIKDINDFALKPANERAQLRNEIGVKTDVEYGLAKKRLFAASRLAFINQGGDVNNKTLLEGKNAFSFPQVVKSVANYRDALEVKGKATREGEHEISFEISTGNALEKFGPRGANLIPKAKATINLTNQTIKIEGNFEPKATLTAIRGALSEYTPDPSSASGYKKADLPKNLSKFEWGDVGDKVNLGIDGKFKGSLEFEFGKGNIFSLLKAEASADLELADLGMGGTVGKGDSKTKLAGNMASVLPNPLDSIDKDGALNKALKKVDDLSSASYIGKGTLTPAYNFAREIVIDLGDHLSADEQKAKFRAKLDGHPKTTEAWLNAIDDQDSKVTNWLDWLANKHEGQLTNEIQQLKNDVEDWTTNDKDAPYKKAALDSMFTLLAKAVKLDRAD